MNNKVTFVDTVVYALLNHMSQLSTIYFEKLLNKVNLIISSNLLK